MKLYFQIWYAFGAIIQLFGYKYVSPSIRDLTKSKSQELTIKSVVKLCFSDKSSLSLEIDSVMRELFHWIEWFLKTVSNWNNWNKAFGIFQSIPVLNALIIIILNIMHTNANTNIINTNQQILYQSINPKNINV